MLGDADKDAKPLCEAAEEEERAAEGLPSVLRETDGHAEALKAGDVVAHGVDRPLVEPALEDDAVARVVTLADAALLGVTVPRADELPVTQAVGATEVLGEALEEAATEALLAPDRDTLAQADRELAALLLPVPPLLALALEMTEDVAQAEEVADCEEVGVAVAEAVAVIDCDEVVLIEAV